MIRVVTLVLVSKQVIENRFKTDDSLIGRWFTRSRRYQNSHQRPLPPSTIHSTRHVCKDLLAIIFTFTYPKCSNRSQHWHCPDCSSLDTCSCQCVLSGSRNKPITGIATFHLRILLHAAFHRNHFGDVYNLFQFHLFWLFLRFWTKQLLVAGFRWHCSLIQHSGLCYWWHYD